MIFNFSQPDNILVISVPYFASKYYIFKSIIILLSNYFLFFIISYLVSEVDNFKYFNLSQKKKVLVIIVIFFASINDKYISNIILFSENFYFILVTYIDSKEDLFKFIIIS